MLDWRNNKTTEKDILFRGQNDQYMYKTDLLYEYLAFLCIFLVLSVLFSLFLFHTIFSNFIEFSFIFIHSVVHLYQPYPALCQIETYTLCIYFTKPGNYMTNKQTNRIFRIVIIFFLFMFYILSFFCSIKNVLHLNK